MEMSYGGTLVMPASYALMDEEEMCYTEGGIHWKRSYVQKAIDVALIVASAGLSSSASVGKVAAKIGWTTLKKKAKEALIKLGIKAALAKTAVDILTTVTGFSIGGGIAWVVDKKDKSGLNGYIDF